MLMKIVYWASTIIAAAMLGMALTYLTGSAQVVEGFKHVGYPQQLRLVLGVAKPAAGVVLLLPGLRLLKEWAYAGAAFAWSMAVIAHWQASAVSDIGSFMQAVGAAWLMVSFGAGPMYIALTQTASSLPFVLLSLPAGAVGDIVDRRKLLLRTEIWMLGVAVVLSVAGIAG